MMRNRTKPWTWQPPFVKRRDFRRVIGGSVSGDRKLKESTPRLAPGRPQPPTIGFDNRAADREAHAHAVGLRRVEGFKETRQALRAQPMAGIPHRGAYRLRLDTHVVMCNSRLPSSTPLID